MFTSLALLPARTAADSFRPPARAPRAVRSRAARALATALSIGAAGALSSACGTVTAVGMEFADDSIDGDKTLFARVRPNGNTVADANLRLTTELRDGAGDLRTEVAEIPIGQLDRDGNRYSYSNNVFVRQVDDPGESLSARWRFRFRGASWPHNASKSYAFRVQLNDFAVDESDITLVQGDRPIEPQEQDGQQLLPVPADRPLTVRVRIHNVGANGADDTIPVAIDEIRPGGSVPPGAFSASGNVLGGLEAGESKTVSFHNVSFPSEAIGGFRHVRARVNLPPDDNPVLLEENTGDNLADSLIIRVIAPAPSP